MHLSLDYIYMTYMHLRKEGDILKDFMKRTGELEIIDLESRSLLKDYQSKLKFAEKEEELIKHGHRGKYAIFSGDSIIILNDRREAYEKYYELGATETGYLDKIGGGEI